MSDHEIVDAAIASRRSLRAFLPTPVSRSEIEEILRVSARAPSGTNMQPWKVYVTMGETKRRLSDAVLGAHNNPSFKPEQTYKYYPSPLFEPYLSRRRAVGWGLYSLLGIEKGEKEKMHVQHGRNYTFFDAPVGLIFTIDERLEIGSWLDYGMFLQNIMTAARGRGLDTCPQAAFAPFHKVIKPVLDIPESEVVVCGMAIGHADLSQPENTLVSEREPLSEFTVFLD
ncbi:MAG: nitroreductase [Rhizobiaceae bacterium]